MEKTILAASLTLSIGSPVTADTLADARQELRDMAVASEAVRDLSAGCKIEIKVFGKEGLKQQDCKDLIKYRKNNKLKVRTKGASESDIIKVIEGDPQLRTIIINFSEYDANWEYIQARMNP